MLHEPCSSARMILVAALMMGYFLDPVRVEGAEGKQCTKLDVFPNKVSATATIPQDCTTLNLDNEVIGDVGATAIAIALQGNTALTTLELDSNNIGIRGATAIAEALKVNTALTTLWLEGNSIGDRGAAAIADALKINTVLTTLDLYYNNIGDAGATSIAEALKVNTALTTLHVDNTNTILDEEITKSITFFLANNKARASDGQLDEDGAPPTAAACPTGSSAELMDTGTCNQSGDSASFAHIASSDLCQIAAEDASVDFDRFTVVDDAESPTGCFFSEQDGNTLYWNENAGKEHNKMSQTSLCCEQPIPEVPVCPESAKAVLLEKGSCDQSERFSNFVHIASALLCEAAATNNEVDAFRVVDSDSSPAGCFYDATKGALIWNVNAGVEHAEAVRTSVCCELEQAETSQVQNTLAAAVVAIKSCAIQELGNKCFRSLRS